MLHITILSFSRHRSFLTFWEEENESNDRVVEGNHAVNVGDRVATPNGPVGTIVRIEEHDDDIDDIVTVAMDDHT